MGFMYPRTIQVDRPAAQSGVGYQPGYAGQVASGVTRILSDLPANTQVRREGSRNATGLPSDATSPFWDVFIPRSAAAAGVIVSRDIITDDLGRRFQVVADDPESLGYRLRCMKLET